MKRATLGSLAILALLLWSGSVCVRAASSSTTSPEITIAPPPLAYPDYTEPGRVQGRAGVTYVNIQGTDVSLTGVGGPVTIRKVIPQTGVA
jgi:hypothetical protein